MGRAHRFGTRLNNPYALKTMRAHFPTFRWWSMWHRRAIPCGGGDGTSVSMPCSSTRRLPRLAIRRQWRAPFALAVEAGRLAYEADPIEARDMASPSTPFSERHSCDGTRPLLPDFRQRGPAGAHGAAWHQACAVARQGQGRCAASCRNPVQRATSALRMTANSSSTITETGAGRRLRLHPSRPGRP